MRLRRGGSRVIMLRRELLSICLQWRVFEYGELFEPESGSERDELLLIHMREQTRKQALLESG